VLRTARAELLVVLVVLVPSLLSNAWYSMTSVHGYGARYLHPVLPVLVVTGTAVWMWLLRRLDASAKRTRALSAITPVVIAALVVGRQAVHSFHPNRLGWQRSEIEALSGRLFPEYSFPEIQQRIQGPQCWELVTALAVYAPAPRAPRSSSDGILVLRPEGEFESWRARGELLETGRNRPTFVRRFHSWLNPGEIVVCDRNLADTGQPPRCRHVDVGASDAPGNATFLFASRSYAAINPLAELEHYETRYELQLTPRGNDRPRRILISESTQCPWSIESVTGLDHRGPLPAKEVTLMPSADRGVIVFAKRFGGECAPPAVDRRTLPCLAEVPAGESWLERLDRLGEP
jgi:hypothetical protein